MSDHTKRKVAELVVQEIPAAQIAEQLNLTASYISQLADDTTFQQIVGELTAGTRIAKQSTYLKIDNNYDKLELHFTDLLVDNIEIYSQAMIAKPQLLNQFMKNINTATRRAAGEQAAPTDSGYTHVKLPNFMLAASEVQVQHNQANEIIEVDGKPLLTMGADRLRSTNSASEAGVAITNLLANQVPQTADQLDL